ncbi:MAG: hypothetical protein KAV00_00615 [Phycisphaerae bacterium]|nr:hypothetical protein [Phycisphaerae bacterium]
MDKEIIVRLHSRFEDVVCKHAESGVEYWCARDLQILLGYTEWRNFAKVIDKAITAGQFDLHYTAPLTCAYLLLAKAGGSQQAPRIAGG